MPVLRAADSIFYHPMNSLVDGDSITWSSPGEGVGGAMAFSFPGKIGTGGSRSGSSGSMSSPSYPGVPGPTRFTVAFWLDFGGIGANDAFAGHIGGGPGFLDSIQAIQFFGSGSLIFFNGDGQAFLLSAGTVAAITTGFHLYVLDLVREGSSWRLRHSVDGAAFTVEGLVAGGAIVNSPTDGVIGTISGSPTAIDEVVLWRDLATPFTATELQNLFDLADTFGAPMDQYFENFESAPICWQATAKMPDGSAWRDSGSGSCPPVIRVPRGASDIIVTDDGKPVAPRVIEG